MDHSSYRRIIQASFVLFTADKHEMLEKSMYFISMFEKLEHTVYFVSYCQLSPFSQWLQYILWASWISKALCETGQQSS